MKRTGQSKIAVVGWGRGMGHTGHMYLADAVIQQAKDMNADPYFFVSKTVGKDDPIFPEEKVRIYQKVFPQYATIFEPQGNLNQALTDLAGLGYQGVVVVVGADQKEAFQYLVKPNKEGVPVYQTMGLKKLKVISRQETRSQYAHEEGPRATPMREILLDPNATEEDKFKVWRRDMPEQLSDRDVLDVMNKAESRMLHQPAKQSKVKAMSQKVAKLKESIQKLKNKNIAESRIIDPKALINAFYVSPQGNRHRVAEKIPYYLLDKLVPLLTKKYAITMNDIEVRPADVSQYKRSSQPELAEEQLDEFAPGNGDDDRPTAEYEVYQCNPQDQFDWIGGPLMQTDDMGKAHGFAYFLWKKHPDKCFMIWQERSQGSRGGYGPEGSVLAPSDEEVDEGYIFKGGFPFDVDHMPGSVIRNRDETTDIVKTKNKDKWDDMVDLINDEVFDDMADFRTNSEGETITGNSAVWAKWDNATQTGWINRKGQPLKPWPIKEQGVDEAYDGFGKFDAAEFQRHMEKLRAREELRKTDPMKALVGDLKDQDAEKELAAARRKKPEDDSMSINDPRHPGAAYTQGNQNIDEVSDKTLMSYLTKVDADSRKHKMDPTKRSDKKASKSVSGFSKAFNKLDSRKPDGTISEDYLDE